MPQGPHLLDAHFKIARNHAMINPSHTGAMSDTGAKSDQCVTGLRRWLYLSLGLFFVGLAALGTILPILPTTPFLLLASYIFSRSSPALRAWLFRLPVWGTLLRDWQTHRAVRPQAKLAAFVCIPLVIIGSVLLTNLSWPLMAMLSGLATIGMIVVWRLPVIRTELRTQPEIVGAIAARGGQGRVASG